MEKSLFEYIFGVDGYTWKRGSAVLKHFHPTRERGSITGLDKFLNEYFMKT